MSPLPFRVDSLYSRSQLGTAIFQTWIYSRGYGVSRTESRLSVALVTDEYRVYEFALEGPCEHCGQGEFWRCFGIGAVRAPRAVTLLAAGDGGVITNP